MTRPSVIAIATCMLVGCAMSKANGESVTGEIPTMTEAPMTTESPCAEATALADWLEFVSGIEALSALELASERDRVFIEHRAQPNDGNRLALAYLLSRPQLLVRDIEKSQALFAEIDAGSVYAPVRDLLIREFAMIDKVADLQTQITHLQTQLDALKAIETDLTENQKELEELPQ